MEMPLVSKLTIPNYVSIKYPELILIIHSFVWTITWAFKIQNESIEISESPLSYSPVPPASTEWKRLTKKKKKKNQVKKGTQIEAYISICSYTYNTFQDNIDLDLFLDWINLPWCEFMVVGM